MVNKMDEYFEGKVKEVQSAEDASYFLENNEIFYDIGFKVMQNQENVNLLECHRLKYNGKIKLVYFTRDYTSMADYIASSDVDTILSLIDSLIRALIQIENLGFLNMACIDNRLSHMYVEPNTNTIKIIYLPVNITGIHKNKNEFDNEIKAQLVQAIEQMRITDNPKMRQAVDALEDGTLKLHDISARIQHGRGFINNNTADSRNSEVHETDVQDRKSSFTNMEFLIGKSSERVQGVITGNNAISRAHCKIVRKNGNYYVVDMGSSNGTYVNGKRIEPNIPEPILDKSQLRIANAESIVRG